MNRSRSTSGAPPVVWAFAGVFCAIEAVLTLADEGVLPYPDLRGYAYYYGAFLDQWFDAVMAGEEVPLWFWSSFFTHAFLHGGVLHLLMNTAVFLALGGFIARAIGNARFLALFAITAVAGALTFGLLAQAQGPMVGASGVIFGLIGALKRWEWRYIRMTGAPANRFWGTIAGLTLINLLLVFYFPGEGSLAWQAHLGGFVAGFLIAPVLAPRAAGPSPI